MELVDVTHDGLLCGHGLVVHVRSRQWTGGECNLVAVPMPSVGHACKRADFWRTRKRTRSAYVLFLYRWRRLDTRLRNAQRERTVCDYTWHSIRDGIRRSGIAHAQYPESGPSVADRAKSLRDGRPPCTLGVARLSADSHQRLLGFRFLWRFSDVVGLYSLRPRHSKHVERRGFRFDVA